MEGKPLVVEALNNLSTDELTYVAARMWHGRNLLDGGSSNFDDQLSYAQNEKIDVYYIAGKMQLGDYLSKGLDN